MRRKSNSVLSITMVGLMVLSGCGLNDRADDEAQHNNELNQMVKNVNRHNDNELVAVDHVREFELEINLATNEEIEMEYNNNGQSKTAEVERDNANGEELKKTGAKAIKEVEELLQQVSIQSDTSQKDAIDQVLKSLNVSIDQVKNMDLEVEFTTGEELNGNI